MAKFRPIFFLIFVRDSLVYKVFFPENEPACSIAAQSISPRPGGVAGAFIIEQINDANRRIFSPKEC